MYNTKKARVYIICTAIPNTGTGYQFLYLKKMTATSSQKFDIRWNNLPYYKSRRNVGTKLFLVNFSYVSHHKTLS